MAYKDIYFGRISLFARWNVAQFMNHLIKTVRSLKKKKKDTYFMFLVLIYWQNTGEKFFKSKRFTHKFIFLASFKVRYLPTLGLNSCLSAWWG